MEHSEREETFRFAQYILKNGYTPKEKLILLEKIGFEIRRRYIESDSEFYSRENTRFKELLNI